ncbi:Fe-S protein assembly co-chaperone HscB [Polytolypa hystricis UAMH7299]|uniref:Fe-S protein assembly co-chaperone HscB n=1 Tax=Polytolypa hystricis (strain UAMH7299) TaxID=1447883 RepID=A0A2B7XHA2_POLH7|nr:Fe-S protein assembly co-chaperone HscB [Polytolypa hystricis UAMH7299]
MTRLLPSPALLKHAVLSSTRSRPATTLLPRAKNSICLLCQHQTQPVSNIRQFHASLPSALKLTNPSTRPSQPTTTDPDEPDALINAPPDITTHYTIFRSTLPNGMPPSSPFTIPLPLLRREFLNLQARAHPDKYPPGPAKQRAEALSARINEAYRCLCDPLSRAQYLLATQHGIDVTSEDGAHAQHGAQDAETLMQVLDVQEAIEEAGSEETIAELKVENEKRIEECVAELAERVDRGDVEGARVRCVKLRFWYSVRQALRDWEPGMREVRLVH